MKKVLSIILTASMATNMMMPVFAAEQEQVQIPESVFPVTTPIPLTELVPAEETAIDIENPAESAVPEEEPVATPIPLTELVPAEDAVSDMENSAESAVPESEDSVASDALVEKNTNSTQAEDDAEVVAEQEIETLEEKTKTYEYNRINRTEIKDITATSEKNPASGNDGPAAYAFDGNMQTMWHSNYGNGVNDRLPMSIEWCIGDTPKQIGKITYYKRAQGPNGVWTKIDVSVKNDKSSEWQTVLSDFALDQNSAKTDIVFGPQEATHIKVTVKTAGGGNFASAAEIRTYEAVEVTTASSERQELREKYADAKEINQSKYTAESVDVLKAAFQQVETVLNSSNSTSENIAEASQHLTDAVGQLQPNENAMAAGKPAPGTTQDNPFPVPVGGSKQVRIPALITLKDGTLAAAIDARWNHHGDHGNIDTLFSISKDNGKTWTYQFPNFFNDAAPELQNNYSATFMDPVMIQGEDGTIYLLVDAFPGGTALHGAAPRHPSVDTGFVKIDEKDRMVLYNSRDNQTKENYDYYVGDYAHSEVLNKNIAPVIAKDDANKEAKYYIDEHFYLYTLDQKPMYCDQLGDDKFVHQNVFFDKASIHVREATYLYLITSEDEGKTWSAPHILNPQVHPGNITFFGVGPGAGLSFVDGQGTNVILLPTYVNPNEHSSFIYSSDKGVTWKHSENTTPDHSSESVLVQIDENTVRQFTRDNGHREIRYTDFEWNANTKEFNRIGTVTIPGTDKTTGNQVSAIRYSKLVDGKPVILFSTATGNGNSRTRGKIYTLTVEADKSMKVLGEPYEVNTLQDDYSYSSLTEMSNGDIALLYENPLTSNPNGEDSKGGVQFVTIKKEQLNITDNALSDNHYVMDLKQYQAVDGSLAPVPSQADIDRLNAGGKVSAKIEGSKVFYTALQQGEETFQYQKNGKEITITFKIQQDPNIQQQDITLNVGETKTVKTTEKVRFHSNPASVEVSQTPITADRALGQAGTNVQYDGEKEALVNAAYTFHKVADRENVYTMEATTKEGKTIYFAGRAATTAGMPYSYKPQEVTLEARGTNEFALYQEKDAQGQTTNDKGYLWFWKNDATKLRFDRNSSYSAGNCDFELYHVDPQTVANDQDLFGFTRVNNLTEIQDGEKYIVVAKVADGTKYVLRPSDAGTHYSHVLKSVGTGPQLVGYETTFKAVKAGKAVVIADNMAYNITVNDPTVPAPNTNALAEEIRTSNAIDLAKYQDGAEKVAFVQALNDAKQIIAHPEDYTQQQVDEAKEKLTAARLALKENDANVPDGGTTPVDPENPNDGGTKPVDPETPNDEGTKPTNPETPNQDNSQNSNQNTVLSNSPATGDTAQTGILLILACGSAIGLAVLRNKKKEQ